MLVLLRNVIHVVPRRAVACVLAGLLIAAACSSKSTNEASGTGGGAVAGPCADAGLGCLDCCKQAQGELALASFLDAVKACTCTSLQEGCVAKCKPACEQSVVVDACLLCVRDDQLAPCLPEKCHGDCLAFHACVQSCGG